MKVLDVSDTVKRLYFSLKRCNESSKVFERTRLEENEEMNREKRWVNSGHSSR
jgi:hypothetical protein